MLFLLPLLAAGEPTTAHPSPAWRRSERAGTEGDAEAGGARGDEEEGGDTEAGRARRDKGEGGGTVADGTGAGKAEGGDAAADFLLRCFDTCPDGGVASFRCPDFTGDL